MLTEIAFYLLVALIAIWVLFEPINRVSEILWEIIISVTNSEPVDLKSKFGHWAIVTGCTDGIGKAYSKELASRGLNLVLISRNLAKLEQVKKEISQINEHLQVKLIVADFSRGREVFKKIEEELENMTIGILVNNVGCQYSYPMYLGELPENELWDMINVNVGTTTMMTRIIINKMKKQGKGAIVNISSGSEYLPLPLMTVYAATKVYIKSFSDALKSEYSKFGITVQRITPMFVSTNMTDFSPKLRVSNLLVPDATTFAKHAVTTLGKIDKTSGYWAHGIQIFFMLFPPMWVRMKIGQRLNEVFRNDYLKEKKT